MENKNEQVQREVWTVERGEARPPQSEVKRELLSSIGLFIGTGLLGFWFGVGAALGAKMVNSLEELIRR